MTTRRRGPLRSVAAAVGVVIALVLPATAAASDVTPPTGTLTIGDGSGYASSLTLTLQVPATDDVGVVMLSVFENGVLADSRPYAPTVTVTVPQDSLWHIGVTWFDAEGNSSSADGWVQVDTTAPSVDFLRFYDDPDPSDRLFPASIGNAWDNGSPITNVRFRTGTGPWGAPIPAPDGNPMVVDWPAFDPVFGGSPTIGLRTVSVEVENAAGLWSPSVSQPLNASMATLSVAISDDRRTGHPVTVTPSFPSDLTFASGTFCRWEFRWGTDQALDVTFTGDTFGGLLFDVPAANGGCGPWTFTLPWVPFRQFDVIVELGQTESDGGQAFGARAHDRFTAAVGSTERRILTSTLPIAQVLPSTYQPLVGQPITYTRYLVGGASTCCNARWVARLGDGENPRQWTQTGGATFTFTPTASGDVFVGWDRESTGHLLLSGYYDPPVRYRDRIAPVATAPRERVRPMATGDTVPIAIEWGGTDRGWGIASYQLQRSLNGGPWTSVALPSATAKSVGVAAAPGSTLRFRVRPKDKAGNLGGWAYGPTFRVARASDASALIHYSSGWTTVADPGALGGMIHATRWFNQAMSYTFSGRDVGWVASRGADHGKAKVWLDGAYIGSIDLFAAVPQARRIVFARHWTTVGTHTVRIVNVATVGRPWIDVDGFAVLR